MPNTRVKGSNQRRIVQVAQHSSQALEAQIATFLKSGGVIEEIPRGVTGQIFTPMAKKS
ncbi:MAG: hypothetical protein GX673_05315 [Gammaproteobacteria bacterium]|mgnify:FL=1|nr:hypothetical protein [Gammaproteobacteria bacterium]HKM26421.1 hypothetical protein [Thiopseudomonas sp.]